MLRKIINILKQTKTGTILFALAMICVFIAIILAYFLSAKKTFLLTEQRQMLLQLNLKRKALQGFEPYRIRIAKLSKSYFFYRGGLSRKYQAKSFIDIITTTAKKYSVELQSLQPGTDQNYDDFFTYTWHITAAGKYHNLIGFIDDISATNFAFFVNAANLELKPETKNLPLSALKKLRLETDLAVYQEKKPSADIHYDKSQSAAPPTKNISMENRFSRLAEYEEHIPFSSARDPFAPGLNFWHANQLKFLGKLRIGNDLFTLIQDPNGIIYNIETKADEIPIQI